MRKTAILVLGCTADPYLELIDTIRQTWGKKSVPGIDIFYLFGMPDDTAGQTALNGWAGGDFDAPGDGGICRSDDLLVTGCPDSIFVQEDCILRKRLIAFQHLSSLGQYDFIHTVCAASYIDQFEFADHVGRLPSQNVFSGAMSIDTTGVAPFISGASMLLSADVARCLAEHRAEVIRKNQFGFRDDVAIGYWIAKHMSSAPIEAIKDAIRTARPLPKGSVFVSNAQTSVDHVMSEEADIRPLRGVFHYHFHSKNAGGMASFHNRYFLHQTKNLWAGPRRSGTEALSAADPMATGRCSG